MAVVLPVVRSGESLHLVVDSTGVQLFGEGEWKVRKHSYSKGRSWRKVRLGLDIKTGQVRAALMTHREVDDASVSICDRPCCRVVVAKGETSPPPTGGAQAAA